MNRSFLSEAVRHVAENAGYFFGMGRDAAIAVGMPSLPTLWLSPLKLKKSSGRSEKHDTYQVEVRLMMAKRTLGDSEEDIWNLLEADAHAVCDALRETAGIRKVSNLSVTPGTKPLSVRGEVYVEAAFEVEIVYYAD